MQKHFTCKFEDKKTLHANLSIYKERLHANLPGQGSG